MSRYEVILWLTYSRTMGDDRNDEEYVYRGGTDDLEKAKEILKEAIDTYGNDHSFVEAYIYDNELDKAIEG